MGGKGGRYLPLSHRGGIGRLIVPSGRFCPDLTSYSRRVATTVRSVRGWPGLSGLSRGGGGEVLGVPAGGVVGVGGRPTSALCGLGDSPCVRGSQQRGLLGCQDRCIVAEVRHTTHYKHLFRDNTTDTCKTNTTDTCKANSSTDATAYVIMLRRLGGQTSGHL